MTNKEIKDKIKSRGMSVAHVARKTNLSYSLLTKIVSNQNHIVTDKTIRVLTRFFAGR